MEKTHRMQNAQSNEEYIVAHDFNGKIFAMFKFIWAKWNLMTFSV